MATTSGWDSDTSTGGKGISRVQFKRSGEWEAVHDIRVKNSGAWKQARKAWVKNSGTWKPVMWHPELNENVSLGQPYVYAGGGGGNHGWAKPYFRWIGGDLFDASSWEHSVQIYQVSCDTYGGNAPDWASGIGGVFSVCDTKGQFLMPSETMYDDGSSIASAYGACTPVWHMLGTDSGGNIWSNRQCYDNPDLSLGGITSGQQWTYSDDL